MYNEEYENEQEIKNNDNFIVNFYYNNKVLIWILIGIIAFILIMSLLTRGGSNSGSSGKYEVSILPDNEVEISIGNSYPLKAKVDKNANAIIIWSSADENIAKVDNGTVTAINYGKTTISATYIHSDDTKYVATKEITVADGNPNLKLSDVSFQNGDLLMPTNSTYDIILSLTPSNGYITDKSFTSSNTNVVTVDNKGHVVSIGEGEATISLNVNNGSFRKSLRVFVSRDYTRSEIVVSPDRINFDSELVKLKIGMSQKLRYTLFPIDADSTKLFWSSSDETIASVDEKGYVKALKEGTATITLRSLTGVYDTIDVEVETDIVPVTDINLSLNDLYLTETQSQIITPTVSPANASNKALSFMPSDTSVIAVAPNQTGTSATIYALKTGTAILTISSVNGVERRLNVVVSSGNSGNNNSGSGSSSSGSEGFRISSKDANNQGFVVTSQNGTINNEATAPVTVTIERRDSSIAKFRVAKCLAPITVCDPSSSVDVTEFIESTVFTINYSGTYLLRIAKYNSSGTQIGVVDKWIAVKGGSSTVPGTNTNPSTLKPMVALSYKCESNGSLTIKDGSTTLSWSAYCTRSTSGNNYIYNCTGKGKYNGSMNNYPCPKSPQSTVSISCGKTTLKLGEQTTCTANLSSGDSVKEWRSLTTNTVSSNKTNTLSLTGTSVGTSRWQVTTNKGATAEVTITVTGSSNNASYPNGCCYIKNSVYTYEASSAKCKTISGAFASTEAGCNRLKNSFR